MQLQGMTITLRQRMPWEATDLGMALVRAHARRIFTAWCVVTVPVWIVLNGVCAAIAMPWIAAVAMWWLKPMFDRVPLYAISRAVFGRTPSVGEIVRAQFSWGWREVWPWLLWRRLHPSRLLLLPVDLLERSGGVARNERVRVLTKGDAGPRNQLVLLGSLLESVLSIAVVMSVLMFVPSAFLSDASRSLYQQLFHNPPLWVLVAFNGCLWFGSTMVEPFLVGAGFGLYLNRRVQLEAWDVEHAFRRIAARLARVGAPSLCLMLVLATAGLAARPAAAMQTSPCPQVATGAAHAGGSRPGTAPAGCDASASAQAPATAASLPALFGANYRHDGGGFANQLQKARAGLNNTVHDWEWVARDEQQVAARPPPGWAMSLSGLIAFLARYGLWIVVIALLAFVLYHHKSWMGWIRETETADRESAIDSRELDAPVVLPDDIPAAVRALWQRNQQRAALALFYQAAVQRLAERLGTPLPPGATEGECLARSRQLNDRRYAGLFVRIVGCWQTAAYARRMPELAALEGLLADWVAPVPAPAPVRP